MADGGSTINLTDRPVELRVHGVGGATPSEVLGVEDVILADDRGPNDGATGFYASTTDDERFPGAPDRQVEAYSWGGLNRASALRAIWLILAPFALANLAGWMIEHDGDATQAWRKLTSSDWISRTLARLAALALTLSATFLTSRIAFDLLVIQCGSNSACTDRWWTWPLAQFPDHGSRRLLVGALLPLALLGLVASITRRSQLVSTPEGDDALDRDPTFADSWIEPGFWTRFGVSHRLGIIHLGAAVVLVGLMMSGAAEQVSRASDMPWITIGLLLLAGAAVGVNVLRLPVELFWGFLAVSGLYLAAVMVQLAFAQPGQFLPGASAASVADETIATTLVVVIATLAVTTWQGRSHRRIRVVDRAERLYRWAMPVALLIAAAGLVSAFGAGTEILVRNLLETTETGPIPVAPTAGIVASTFLIALVALVVTGLLLYIAGLRNPPALDAIAEDYEGFVDRPILERIARARVLARLSDQVPAAFIAATVVLVVIVLGVFAQVLWAEDGFTDPGLANPFQWLETTASALLVTLPITGGFLLLQSYRSPSVRRVVGTLWDVATFWPRRFHPFAPPSYGERAVPDVRNRMAFHASKGVLLSAHSQGSVLALAAVAASDVELGLVAMLTHGSPIERLYARFFPEYVSDSLVADLVEQMEGRWTNLYRDTDFIGGAIPDVGSNVRLIDPAAPDGPIASHFGYEETDQYLDALRRLI